MLMEAENFFLKSNVYFRELKKIRDVQKDAAKEDCSYPFSWQELQSGKLEDISHWQACFEETGTHSYQVILAFLPVKGGQKSIVLCIPIWIDRSGAFIHGGDFRTLPWVQGQGQKDTEIHRKAEAFMKTYLQAFLDTREWRQFFKLCVQLFESLEPEGDWKENIVFRRLEIQEEEVQEYIYDAILHESSSNRLYRNLFFGMESLGSQSDLEYVSELRGHLEVFEQAEEQELLLAEYIQSVKQMKRAPLIAVLGKEQSQAQSRLLTFWEELMLSDKYPYELSFFDQMELEEESSEYRLFEKAESETREFRAEMDQLLTEVQGSIQETKTALEHRISKTEKRLQKMEEGLQKENREIDRVARRKNEWSVFLDSVSGGRYKLGIWKKSLARKMENFYEEQDLPVIGDKREAEEILEAHDCYMKELLLVLRKQNDIYNEYKQKNSRNKERLEILETSLPAMRKMVEKSLGVTERDRVDWEALKLLESAELEKILKEVYRKFQYKTTWFAFRYCGCSHSENNPGIILCDYQEFSRRFYRGRQEFDSLDLLIILDADNVPVEDGIWLGNFARRMILLRGDKRWKGGVAEGIRRLLMQKLELGEKQQEVYCRIETLWDMANVLLFG